MKFQLNGIEDHALDGGLAEQTSRLRACYARKCLERKFGHGILHWNTLTPGDVVTFVTGYTKR